MADMYQLPGMLIFFWLFTHLFFSPLNFTFKKLFSYGLITLILGLCTYFKRE